MVERDPFPIAAAQLSGNFCETLFYGIYLATCMSCARTLVNVWSEREERWPPPHKIHWVMAITALILFAICTFDTTLGLLHNFHAFVDSTDPESVFKDIADWINIARSVNQATAMIIGDFVLVLRCWVIYGHQWLVVTPSIILFLANIAMAARLIEIEASPMTDRGITLNSDQIQPWWLSFFIITALQNTLTTSMLIWRIRRVERQNEVFMSQGGTTADQPYCLRKVIRAIAESGAAYTTCVVITFIVSATKSNALYPAADMTLIATGIAFNVILIRSSTGRPRRFTVYDHNHNEEMIALGAVQSSTATRTTLGRSIHVTRQSGPQEVELTDVKSEADKISPRDDLYPVGIKVTTTVVTS